MRSRPIRDYVLIVLAAIFTVACVSLGFWQLRRLAERRALNAKVFARLNDPAIPVGALPHDTSGLHYRRVIVSGTYDYAHQVRIANRIRGGSPGVNIITPLRMAGTDTALLVNRGWVYSPDGVTVDLGPWRETDSVSSAGYVRPLESSLPGKPTLPNHPGVYRWLDTTALRGHIPYPVFPFVVVLQGDTTGSAGVPPRVQPPPLDEGPHMDYAIQWFSFAIIAVVGMFFFLRVVPAGRAGREFPDR